MEEVSDDEAFWEKIKRDSGNEAVYADSRIMDEYE